MAGIEGAIDAEEELADEGGRDAARVGRMRRDLEGPATAEVVEVGTAFTFEGLLEMAEGRVPPNLRLGVTAEVVDVPAEVDVVVGRALRTRF